MAVVIDGKALAARITGRTAADAARLAAETGSVPSLAAVLVGEDPASRTYVRNKERACAKAGMRSVTVRLPAGVSEAELLDRVAALNLDPGIHGILVQLPLPGSVATEKVVEAISPLKDVDSFHPENLGLLIRGRPRFLPCTPAGIMEVLADIPVELAGAGAVIVGRSLLVGRPLALMLVERHATVTVCHTRTGDLAGEVARADVVVAAAGCPGLVRGEWIRPGAVVIDVGTTMGQDGKLKGDVEFEAASERAGWITPVPGGVGPLTIAMLLRNVVRAAELATRARHPSPRSPITNH